MTLWANYRRFIENKIDEVITIAVDKALSPILEYLKNIEAIAKVQVESLVLIK